MLLLFILHRIKFITHIFSSLLSFTCHLAAGFLNANPNPQAHARVANYGLMDQMAALHWIQQNIQKFGGDPNAVTLAGHGTGAACINFLMTSPTMVRGLFHRAILMSGSAYSSWALVEDPVSFAIKLAKEVNCSIPEDLNKHHEQIVDCLREVPLEDLYAADIQAPSFLTSFGPSVSYETSQEQLGAAIINKNGIPYTQCIFIRKCFFALSFDFNFHSPIYTLNNL